MSTPYPYTVEFSKVFLSGPMKGLMITECIGFCLYSDARFFAGRDGSIITPCAGASDYRQENSTVTRNYEVAA